MTRLRDRSITDLMLPLAIGAAAFYVICGFSIVRPSNLGWLTDPDPLTHFLGWEFFRHGPWTVPLGGNPRYGMELSNSILFSDSLPLLALPFKAFSALLPGDFQYTGGWLLLCCMLQAYFAWKLVGLATEDRWVRALVSALFVFMPALMFRIGGHFSLAAHFLVLAGLYLSFRPRPVPQIVPWTVLVGISAAVHPYLLFMIGALWGTDWLGRLIGDFKPRRIYGFLVEFFIVTLVLLLICWQVGYFMVGDSVSASGFGFYRMNLISIVNPIGWSSVLKDWPGGNGDYEGISYLGLGALLLALFAMPAALASPQRMARMVRYRPLVLVLFIILTTLALSSRIGVGPETYTIAIAPGLEGFLNVFRASGRMFWPVMYTILFVIMVLLVRTYPRRIVVAMLAIALVMQVVDTSPGWIRIHDKYSGERPLPVTSLRDPFWTEAGTRYRNIRRLFPSNAQPDWGTLALFADAHAMSTDVTYLARVNSAKLAALQREATRLLVSGDYERDTLYVLENSTVLQAALHIDRTKDLIRRADGYTVVAPGWKSCTSCTQSGEELHLGNLLRPVAIGERITFASGSPFTTNLLAGWSASEPWGTWTLGTPSTLILTVKGSRPASMSIDATAFVSPSHPEQVVEFRIDDGPITRKVFNQFGGNTFKLSIPPNPDGAPADQVIRVHVNSIDPVRGMDAGFGTDERLLGFGIIAITLLKDP